MKLDPRRFLVVVCASTLALSSCGSRDEAAKPIVFSGVQTSRSASAANESLTGPASDSKMAIAPYSVEYTMSADLPAFDGSAQSWKSDGAPSKATMQKLVAALGVDAPLTARSNDQGGGLVAGPTDGSAPSVSFNDDAYHSWYYSTEWSAVSKSVGTSESAVAPDAQVSSEPVPAEPVPADEVTPSTDLIAPPDTVAPPKNLPSKNEARAKALDLMSAAGIDVREGDVEVCADDWSVSVTAWPHVGDQRVPLAWNVGFGAEGSITWAGGNLIEFTKGPKFPRVGTEAGVKRLGDPKYSGWFGYGAVARGIASDAAVPAIKSAPSANASSDAAPSDSVVNVAPADSVAPVQVQKVVLTGVTETLTPVIDKDDIVWLLPSYEYTAKDGYVISALAITDAYIDQSQIDSGSDVPTTDGGGTSGSSSGSSGSGSVPSGGAVVEPVLPAPDSLALSSDESKKLIGLTEDEASKVAATNGWIIRVGARDGESFALTDDFVTNRVTVTIVDGKVTDVSVG